MNGQEAPYLFASLAEVMPEVDRLLAGHRTVGPTGHLGKSATIFPGRLITSSVDGLLVQNALDRSGRRSARSWSVGWLLQETGRFPRRDQARPRSIFPSRRLDLDARAEAEALRAAVKPPMPRTQALSPTTRSRVRSLVRPGSGSTGIHCAHHLGFVLAETASPGN